MNTPAAPAPRASRTAVLLAMASLYLTDAAAAAPAQPVRPPAPPPVPAPAPPAMIASWTSAEMKAVVAGMGLTVVRETRLDNGDPLLVVRSPSGASFVIQGGACVGLAAAARCQGANLTAFIPYETPAKAQAALDRVVYPFVTVALDDDRTLSISRYIIFDEGIHRRNLEANIRLFLAILDEARGLQ